MRLSDVLQDRLDTANKSRAHVMAMAIQKQKRIEELTERLTAATDDAKEAEAYAEELEARNKELTLQLLATSGQGADALDKLTKAVEALRNILSFDDLYPWRIAREVLAELEGKDHG